jgi:hypothetical protein
LASRLSYRHALKTTLMVCYFAGEGQAESSAAGGLRLSNKKNALKRTAFFQPQMSAKAKRG